MMDQGHTGEESRLSTKALFHLLCFLLPLNVSHRHRDRPRQRSEVRGEGVQLLGLSSAGQSSVTPCEASSDRTLSR